MNKIQKATLFHAVDPLDCTSCWDLQHVLAQVLAVGAQLAVVNPLFVCLSLFLFFTVYFIQLQCL